MVNLNKVEGTSHLHRLNKDNRNREAKGGKAAQDKVEISAEGRALLRKQYVIDLVKASLRDIPEVRQGKVQQVMKRIREGYYNNEDVQRATASRILESYGLNSSPKSEE